MSFLDLFCRNIPDPDNTTSGDEILDRLPRILTKVLIGVAALVFLSGLIAFFVRKDRIGENYRKTDPSVEKVINRSKRAKDTVSAYTNLGQLRITIRQDTDKDSSVLVISPWFSYPQGDTAFEEEIAKKERQIKAIFADYFSSYTKKELLKKGEDQIKQELKDTINSQLVLNQIKDLYFNEYIFF